MNLENPLDPADGSGVDAGQEVQARAEALWPRAATSVGLPEAGATFRRLQVNSRRQGHRSVVEVRLPDGDRFVLRADFDAERSHRFANVLARHRSAVEGLRPLSGVSAPAILWEDPQNPYYLMAFAPGDTAFRRLEASDYGFGARGAVLRQIGQAVAALHRVSEVGERQFWPKSFLTRISACAQAVRGGQLAVPKPNRFLGLCAFLHRAARRARQQSFIGAVEHGDLHLRNMLMTDSMVSFIDFSNHKETYPQRDLASIWLANCPDHLAKDGREPGYGLVAKEDWAAFQDGYGANLVDDPVFRFFFALRLFTSWSLLTKKPQPLDVKALRRADAFVAVFDALLAEETD